MRTKPLIRDEQELSIEVMVDEILFSKDHCERD
jgi:hypothetical protein